MQDTGRLFKDGNSAYYTFLNRGKKSIGLNTASEEGRKIALDLIKDANVVCENFKYGSMERMGLDYETVKKVNPSVIYASLNGFGQTGPLKENHRSRFTASGNERNNG